MIIHSTTLDTMDKVIAIYGGTTWTKIEGRFLLGQSSSHAINSTGGEETHKLTVNEMPSHSHNYSLSKGTNVFANNGYAAAYWDHTNTNTSAVGGDQAHNNMPPYKTVYIWERTK